jgi:hypothetical protein
MSAEDVSVRDASLLEGIFERAGNMFLPDDVGELLWPVLTGEGLLQTNGVIPKPRAVSSAARDLARIATQQN